MVVYATLHMVVINRVEELLINLKEDEKQIRNMKETKPVTLAIYKRKIERGLQNSFHLGKL